jgi:hypothetical protein
VSQPALSLNFFSPEHGLHGSARSGMTLLFEGAGSQALPDGPKIEAVGDGWHAELEGSFSLDLKPVAPAAELEGVTVRICSASGQIGTQKVTCLATLSETHVAPSWDELDALRTISALFDEGHAFLAVGRRPRGALGHSAESTAAWLLNDGEAIEVEDARISTVYDGEGRQRSAGLELWLPGEDLPLRGSGSVVAGSSLQLESADVHAAIFRWRMGNREGAGSYELMTRAAPDEAA